MNKIDRRKAKQIIKDALKSVKEQRLAKVTVRKPYDKIQNNETCPCESGHKYKHCCKKKLDDREQMVYENIHARHRAVEQIKKLKRIQDGNSPDNIVNSPLILPDTCRDEKKQIIIP
jgi:hypothetical protein